MNRSLGKIVTLVLSLCVSATCSADVYDVYIAAGQSNMDGRGLNSELVGSLAPFSLPQADVPIYYSRPVDPDNVSPAYESGWTSLAPGYSVPPGYTGALPSHKFGPEVSFGRAAADNTSGRKVAIIKVSRGGTSLSSKWDPSDGLNGDKGYMYEGFEVAVPAAIAALQAQGHSVELRGMIWHQGESDGSSSQYEANLTEFIQVVRQDLGYANLPFLIGELESVDGGREVVRAAQASVAAAMDFAEFVPSTGLTLYDGTHFTAASQIEFGQRFATTMQSAISNLAGDFNRNGTVDDGDHGLWQSNVGSTTDARADGNNDGVVDQLDFTIWFNAHGGEYARSDLNHDTNITIADWEIFRQNNAADLSGLTPQQARALGDLDGNLTNDSFDFAIFQSDFNLANGEGAFVAMLQDVPEPSCQLLLGIGILGACLTRRASSRDAR